METIVYLYTEIMPYQTVIFKEYSKLGNAVHAFYLDKKRQTPYVPDEIDNVFYYPKGDFTKSFLLKKIIELNPTILLVCGWSDKDYLYIARYFKRKKIIPVVCPIDTQFTKRIKQFFGFIIAPFYIKSAFTHIWIPGARQYEFARLLGYSKSKIVFNSLSCDVELFSKVKVESKLLLYPKRFLFVGRFNKLKGLELLVEAWNSIFEKKGWILTLVGNGPDKNKLQGYEGIEVIDFMDQEKLINLAQESGCFILPSIYEPWALVIHEFAAAGLPIICSDACGASVSFVVKGFNGFIFKSRSVIDLRQKLISIISCDDKELIRMSYNSKKLAKSITPEISAASFLSVLE
jgi:glycosyltransferase involved in cell wall biosynthesis